MISVNKTLKTFYLETENSSIVLRVLEDGTLSQSYFGAKIGNDNLSNYHLFHKRELCPESVLGDNFASPSTIPQICPTTNRGDFRTPALSVQTENGRAINELTYKSYEILDKKPTDNALPYLKCEAQTLAITLVDTVSGFEVVLYITPLESEDAFFFSNTIKNVTDKSLKLLRAASVSLDMAMVEDFDVITLDGTWGRERHINRRPITFGVTSVESRRGATGHEHNCFMALAEKGANENMGTVFGAALVYSGDFRALCEKEPFGYVRYQLGILPDSFSWLLNSGESFSTPEAIVVYSDEGLGGMSRSFHTVCRKYINNTPQKNLPHPIVINNWESMYFEVDEVKMKRFINNCIGLGIDTVVLDDGWFGKRNSDEGSLGDWFINREKFPGGLDEIIKICKDNSMRFGLWFEPEMISEKSELYKAHPDWCIHTADRKGITSRNQLILDFTRSEVVDYVYGVVAKMLTDYEIGYVKWDMNRNITDNGSEWLGADRQGEFNHRYILGVYDLARRLTNNFPNVFFEGCSGGGGRFDFGMLSFMSQIWTSDDTDAVERMKIQYGTSLVYPPEVMSAHVSAVPNHQTGRTVSFETRANVAQFFSFGYELDVGQLTEDDRAKITGQTDYHRSIEELITTGDFYRLNSPFTENYCAWCMVSKDKNTAAVMLAQVTAEPASAGKFIKLKGLDPDKNYKISSTNEVFSGKTLMNAGIPLLILEKDHASMIIDIKAV